MNEFGLIARHFRPLAKHPGALSLQDDAAIVDVPPGKQLIVTKDAIAQGVHFIGDEEPALIARKLLRANLSDLAAKGAVPLGYLLMVALPKDTPDIDTYLASFAQGLKEDQDRFAVSLLGGDTIATQGLPVFSITALGLVDTGKALLRSGAKPGDHVYVSGTIGDAFLGLKAAKGERSFATDYLLSRYRLPEPRLALGRRLIGIASSCMDVSDGLAQDAAHIGAASGVGITLHAAQVPLSDEAREEVRKDPALLAQLLTGGDDYELLFTAPPDRAAALDGITEIGVVTSGGGVTLLSADGKALSLPRKGYSHFG